MKSDQRGDTIIEVLLATVVISIVIAGAYTLTNRATRINQSAIERTAASNIMREQIELIRGARTAGPESEVWIAASDLAVSSAPDYGDCVAPSNAFYIDPNLNSFDNDAFVIPYNNTTNYDGLFRVWAEGYEPSDGFIDFHVRVCWQGIGGEGEQRASLVMRIAE